MKKWARRLRLGEKNPRRIFGRSPRRKTAPPKARKSAGAWGDCYLSWPWC